MSGRTTIIMLIDDDRDDRFFFSKALKKMPVEFELVEAMDGVDAFKKLRESDIKPAVIFLDINMPFMNGIEFLKELKKDPNLNTIPVIIQSTSNAETDISVTLNLGAVDYIIKPMDVSLIPGQLEAALQK